VPKRGSRESSHVVSTPRGMLSAVEDFGGENPGMIKRGRKLMMKSHWVYSTELLEPEMIGDSPISW